MIRLAAAFRTLGRPTGFQYDAVGNLTNVVYPTLTLRYAFDALNRLTNMVDGLGPTRFSYHANGALAAEDGPWRSQWGRIYNIDILRDRGRRLPSPRGLYEFISRGVERYGDSGGDGVFYVATRHEGRRLAEVVGRVSGRKDQAAAQGIRRFRTGLATDAAKQRFVERLRWKMSII